MNKNYVNTNVIVDLDILQNILSEMIYCTLCGGQVSLCEDACARIGPACKLKIVCNNCNSEKSFYTSQNCSNSDLYEINVRLILASS